MAYEKQTWEDRQVENPLTFTQTNNLDGSITLTPYPGTVQSEGSKMSAERFNHMEEGIYGNSVSVDEMKWVLLYENEKGTNGTIVLSDTYDNYEKFDIYSKEGSIMTCYNNSNEEGCNIGYPKPIAISSVTMQVKTQQLFFKDSNTITRGIGKTIGFGNPGDGVVQNIVENMIITKVIGYKKQNTTTLKTQKENILLNN